MILEIFQPAKASWWWCLHQVLSSPTCPHGILSPWLKQRFHGFVRARVKGASDEVGGEKTSGALKRPGCGQSSGNQPIVGTVWKSCLDLLLAKSAASEAMLRTTARIARSAQLQRATGRAGRAERRVACRRSGDLKGWFVFVSSGSFIMFFLDLFGRVRKRLKVILQYFSYRSLCHDLAFFNIFGWKTICRLIFVRKLYR